jgi:O-antigen/teichoic acid export membrane protein
VSNNSLFSIIKNTSAAVAIRGAFGLARIIVLLVIARKFGPSEFGQLSLAISIIDIFKVIADLGVDTIIIRRIAANVNSTEKLFGNILSVKLLLSTVCFFASPVVYGLFYGSMGGVGLVFVIAFSIYTSLLVNAFVSYFQAKLSMAKVVVSNLIGSGVYVLLTILGIFNDLPLYAVVLAMPLSELVTLAFMFRQFSKEAHVRLEFDKTIIFDVLKESVFVGISGIIVVIYLRLDTLVIGWLVGDRGVGEYAFAYRLVEPFLLIFTSLATSLYASLSGAWGVVPPAQIWQTIKRVIFPVVTLALLGILGLLLLGRPFITLISDKYLESGNVLFVLSWSILFKAINTQLTAILNSLGKFRIIMIIAANNLLLSMAFNVMLVPSHGILGAAATVVLVEAINMLIQLTCISYVTSNFFGRWLKRWQNNLNRR